jgi:hypothetical protein
MEQHEGRLDVPNMRCRQANERGTAMTPETRTIDLAALATELEAEAWSLNTSYPHLKTLSHHGRYIWAHEDRIEFWQEDEYGNTTSITLPDPVWQTALAIVQRHIDGSRS